jgi:putative ABC transport system permease protein
MVSSIPVTLALSARPPRPRPTHHSTIVAALLIAVGIGSLACSGRDSGPLIVAGILATILGTLLLGPLAIRIFARAAAHAPIATRLALRDLARYQARSGAALAAITLALGIAASDRQIRVYTGATPFPDFVPTRPAAQLDRMAARVRELGAALGDAAVTPLHSAYQAAAQPGAVDGVQGLATEVLKRKVDDPESSRWSGRGMSCWGPADCYVHEARLYVRHTRAAQVHRYRPRGGRSPHGFPGPPIRPDRRARHHQRAAHRPGRRT